MVNYPPPRLDIVTAILAGGHARRLQGAVKATLVVAGHPLLARVLATLSPQCGAAVLCVAPRHGNAPWLKGVDIPVIFDVVDDGGPLAAIAAALLWAGATLPGIKGVVTVPVDEPFVPPDLVARLADAAGDGIAVAESGERRHHAIAYWPVAMGPDLQSYVKASDDGAVHRWQSRYPVTSVRWPTEPYDPFFNINTADDLRTAARIAAMADGGAPLRMA
jgi:molybdopterin-guanine dinucleotide biosynthesis protein A